MADYFTEKNDKVIDVEAIVTSFVNDYTPGYAFRGEAHDMWELNYVVEGGITVTAGSRIYELKKGQLILFEPMEFHRFVNMSDSMAVLSVVSFFADVKNNIKGGIYNLSANEVNILTGIIEDATIGYKPNENGYFELVSGREADAQLARNKLEMLLIKLAKKTVAHTERKKSVSADNYMKAVKYLSVNTDKKLTVSQIANALNMSVSSLNKTFNAYSGIGIIKYFNILKMRIAVNLLNEGYSVKETAAHLGFGDPNYFSYSFKRETGKNPTEY